ncbi:MAG: NUDIX domain-containing protein, partial [Promethearchaeota archaeon]
MSETETTGSDELQFVYRKELWFANLIINSTKIDIKKIVKDLESTLKSKLKKLGNKDIPNCEWSFEVQNSVIEISKHIDFKISWKPVMKDFPYVENRIHYNQAGYLEFDVEYYKEDANKKKELKPWILHEVPVYVLNQIKQYATNIDHVIVDNDPMYIVAVADRTEERGLRVEVPWTDSELKTHKKTISQWVSLYSGRWEDYRERFLANTVETNLAFRKSELHYIRDESAFFYISESDFNDYFDTYYKSKILKTIGEMRAFQNGIIIINQSLDELKNDINTVATFKLEDAMGTLSELDHLAGEVESKISEIKNDLESNRYRYYKKILKYVYEIMDIDRLSELLQKKIRTISDSLQNREQIKQHETRLKVEESTRNLSWFFSLGLLADIVAMVVTIVVSGFSEDSTVEKAFTIGISGAFTLLLFTLGVVLLKKAKPLQKKDSDGKIKYTVDAVIVDKKDRIILIKRKFEPFAGEYALPGGFTELAEDSQEALVRETREETGVDLQFGEWVKIGIFNKFGRDPRGPVHTTAYLCQISDIYERTKDYPDTERLVIIN